MIGVNDKIWFLREGLFAKYVMSLVGLVVFVLAVNGATETWIEPEDGGTGAECEAETWAQPACRQAIRTTRIKNLRPKELPSASN